MKEKMERKKQELSPLQCHVLFEKGTEQAFSGKWLLNKEKGMYVCANCGNELFSSDTKFDSGTGWPSFWNPASNQAVKTKPDRSLGLLRTEVNCANCGAHLGHVFNDGPNPTGMRYCINSVVLDFASKTKKEEKQ